MHKKNKSILDAVKYYCIIPLVIFAIILFFAKDYVFILSCRALKITERSALYKLWELAVYLGLLALWLFVSFTILRSKRYKALTGRNYGADTKYKRSYAELVDYFRDADPHKLDTSEFHEIDWKKAHGFIFGRDGKHLISIPEACESNIAIMGPPGAGKTSGIAIINALRFKGSVLAIDIKGDIYNFCKDKRKIVRFCPDSPTALQDSCHFNPLQGIHEMTLTDKKLYIEAMATVLIPDEGGSDGSYFTSRARKYFQGVTHLLLSRDPNTTFPDIIHEILKGNAFDWVTEAMESDCTEASELLSSFYGNSEKNISGAYDNLCTALTSFSNPILDELLDGKGNCISIDTLEKGYDIYLQISQEHLDAYAPLFTMILQSFSTAFTKRPDTSTGAKNRNILVLCDEFPACTFSYKLINNNLSTNRSKSIVWCLIQQNLSQLEYRYQPVGARSLLGNCNYQVILGSNDINSSKVFSDTFGTRKVLKISNSETTAQNTTSGSSTQEAREPVLYPEDFGDLPSKNQMVIYFKGKHCLCQKLNCYKD